MQNIRNIDVIVSMNKCAETMFLEVGDSGIVFGYSQTLKKLHAMLTKDFCDAYSSDFDFEEEICFMENVAINDDTAEQITTIGIWIDFCGSVIETYKTLTAGAFSEEFVPISVD